MRSSLVQGMPLTENQKKEYSTKLKAIVRKGIMRDQEKLARKLQRELLVRVN